MWSIHVFGTLQCIVPAVQELLGVCTVLYMQEGYSMSGGVEGRGDGECVHRYSMVCAWVWANEWAGVVVCGVVCRNVCWWV